MDIQPLTQPSLVDTITERLRAVIEQGGLKPGDRLPSEQELVQRLGVSRNALREAVVRLESLGVVTIQRGRGMFVGEQTALPRCVQLIRSALTLSSSKDLGQFIEFRKAIECHAVRAAAAQATPEDVEELETLYQHMCNQEEGYDDLARADFEFHKKLLAIAGNDLMCTISEVLQEFILASIVKPMPRANGPESRRLSAQLKKRYHLPILNAIRARDPDAAEKAMRSHMDYVSGEIRKIETQKQMAAAK
jgi:GntR family transcriptional repressor for pyruvate dehydrogenase complex